MQAHNLETIPRSRPTERATPESRQGSARVVAVDERGGIALDTEDELIAARAASCLLEPSPGDRVWFVAEGSESFVTAVLQRSAQAGPSRLRVDGDAELEVGGRFGVAGRDLDFCARGTLGVQGDEVVLRAGKGRAFLRECSVVARELVTHATKSTLVGSVIETFSDLLRSHSRNSMRVVDEMDQLQAGNIEHRASSVAQLSGKNTLLGGGELIKADAGQIHLG